VAIHPGTGAAICSTVVGVVRAVPFSIGVVEVLADAVAGELAFQTDRVDEASNDLLGVRRVDGDDADHHGDEQHQETEVPFHD